MFVFIWAMSALLYLATVFFFGVHCFKSSRAEILKAHDNTVCHYCVQCCLSSARPHVSNKHRKQYHKYLGMGCCFCFPRPDYTLGEACKHGKREMKGK